MSDWPLSGDVGELAMEERARRVAAWLSEHQGDGHEVGRCVVTSTGAFCAAAGLLCTCGSFIEGVPLEPAF